MGVGADGLAHQDARAVLVAGSRNLGPATVRIGVVGIQHLVVVAEAAGREHHALARLDGHFPVLGLGDDADDAPALISDKTTTWRLSHHFHALGLHCGGQSGEDVGARGRGLGHMPAWHRHGYLGELARLLVAAVAQAEAGVVAAQMMLGVHVTACEIHAALHTPVVQLGRLVGQHADGVLVRVLAGSGHKVVVEVLGVVLQPELLLQLRAAHHDEAAAGHGGAARVGKLLQQHYLGARAGSLDSGRRSRTAEANDHDVGLLVPLDISRRTGRRQIGFGLRRLGRAARKPRASRYCSGRAEPQKRTTRDVLLHISLLKNMIRFLSGNAFAPPDLIVWRSVHHVYLNVP